MKRTLSLCLILLMLCGLVLPAFAGSMTASAKVTDVVANAGETVTVRVTLSEAVDDIGSGNITVSFDEGLTLVKGTGKWLIKKTLMADFNDKNDKNDKKLKGVFAFANVATVSGDVFELTFSVPMDARPGTVYRVECKLGLKNGNEQDLTVETTAGSIRIGCLHESYSATWTYDESGHWHACVACGDAKDFAGHVYDNSCDTTCNVCGYTRRIQHSFSTAWQSDATGHWHVCTVCGAKSEVVKHTPGSPATEKSPQTCTACGYVLNPALPHTHVYSDKWTADATYHWHACAGCSSAADKTKHVYDNSCDTTCNICGYTRKITHTYTSWLTDGNKHWHVCTVCGALTDQAAHEYDNACDPTCNVCGYVRDASHVYGTEWHSDEEGHWHVCTVCGEPDTKVPHVPSGAGKDTEPSVCENCGYEIAPAAGHTFSGWTLTKMPTLTEEGEISRTCSCGETEKLPFPKLTEELLPFAEILPTILTSDELEAIAKGAKLSVYIDVSDAADRITDGDKSLILAQLGENGEVIGYYGLTLYKKIGDGKPVPVDDFGKALDVTVTVPEAFRTADGTGSRTYRILQVTDGTVKVIDGTYNAETGEFTFSTDSFRDCALVYSDAGTDPVPGENKDGRCQWWILWVILGILAAAGIFFLLFFRKKKKEADE